MKHPRFLLLTALPAALILSCACSLGQAEDSLPGSISVSPRSYEAKAGGESFELSVKANKYWRVTSSESWLTVSPSSGRASDTGRVVKVTVGANVGGARTARLTFGFIGDPATDVVNVSQRSADLDGIRTLTIAEFKEIQDNDSQWYRVTAEIISVAKPKTGVIYVSDDSGQLLVYHMSPTRGGTYNDFYKLGLKVGDVVTFVAHKTTHSSSGTTLCETDDAYYESHRPGKPLGYVSQSAMQKWIELPETDSQDGLVFLSHSDKDGRRNYSLYYDTSNRVARWACYPYVNEEGGSGRNGDPYAYDPLVDERFQPDLEKSYRDRKFGEEEYVRGHLVPSNDRSGRANYELFYSTNIIPQSTRLNSGVWSRLELKAHDVWAAKCDTLYVVTGTYAGESDRFVTDNSGEARKSLVPEGVYKAFLARLSDGSYHALGAYFENKASSARDFSRALSISVDKLEEMINTDLFVNLPDDVESAVEAEDPSKVDWWWK